MATSILVNVDLGGNQLLGLRAEFLASDPTAGALYEGRLWYNSTTKLLKYRTDTTTITIGSGIAALTVDNASIEDVGTGSNPSIRVKALGVTNAMLAGSIALSKLATDPLARANHTGTQLAATISDLATVVQAYRLDQFAAPNASVAFNNQKITGMADGTATTDAATWGQVQAAINGLDFGHPNVKAATTAALPANTRSGNVLTETANGAFPTIDGVTFSVADRILVKDESTGANNGIYTLTNAGGAGSQWTLTRATDADATAEVSAGLAVFVDQGTTQADTLWFITTADPITLNTTALAFAQMPTPNSLTAGTGLTRTGNTIALTSPVAIANGGTNATTAAAALANLGGVGRYATDIGDGSATSYVITHGLTADKDKVVLVRQNGSPYAEVIADVEFTSTTTITIKFATAPTSAQYRVIVIG